MSEHKSGAVSREYHIAVVEKKDRELSTLKARNEELLELLKKEHFNFIKLEYDPLVFEDWADSAILGDHLYCNPHCPVCAAIANAEKDNPEC